MELLKSIGISAAGTLLAMLLLFYVLQMTVSKKPGSCGCGCGGGKAIPAGANEPTLYYE